VIDFTQTQIHSKEGMVIDMISEERILRIEDKLDEVTTSMVRLEEQGKLTYSLLVKHDASGAKALAKAEKLEDRMDANEAMYKVPMKWLTLLAKIAGAIATIYAVVDIIRRMK
jgi:hypothetical protein